MWNKRRNAVFRAELEVERRIGQIAQHGAGRGVLARPPAIEQRVAHHVAADEHRVEHVVHAGQHVSVRDQRRVNRNLNFGFAIYDIRFTR